MNMNRALISLFLAGCSSVALAASPSIGFVKSTGEFRVDGSAIRGNSTLFDGSLVETTAARSVLQISDVQITLAPESRARVFRDRTVIEKGSGVVRDSSGHVLEARTLRITPASRDSVVQVDVAAPRGVSLVASVGSAQVRNSAGVLVASLRPGVALALDPQAASPTSMKLTGVVVARDGHYFLTDSTANVTVELEGPDVPNYVGKCVDLTGASVPGATPATGATQLVHPSSIKTSKSCKAAAAAAGAAGAGAGAAAAGTGVGAGLSAGATAAIIGGVAVGGTLIGLVAAGTFSGESSASPR